MSMDAGDLMDKSFLCNVYEDVLTLFIAKYSLNPSVNNQFENEWQIIKIRNITVMVLNDSDIKWLTDD